MMYVTRPLRLPNAGTKPIFNFYQGGQSGQGGYVEVLDIMGLVVAPCAAVANASNLLALVTGPVTLATVTLCATVSLNGVTAGAIFSITGTLADAGVLNPNGVDLAQAQPIHIAFTANGQILLNCAGNDNNTGLIQWYLLARAAYGTTIVGAVQ